MSSKNGKEIDVNYYRKIRPRTYVVESETPHGKGETLQVERMNGIGTDEIVVWKCMGKYKAKRFSGSAYLHSFYPNGNASARTLRHPLCVGFFQRELEKAREKHMRLKTGLERREHAHSLTYARNRVRQLEKTVKLARLMWVLDDNIAEEGGES